MNLLIYVGEYQNYMKIIRAPFKIHGGKSRLKNFIISHLPPNYENLAYCEPFCGGCNILLNKKESQSELINDINSNTINLLRFIKDDCVILQNKLRTLIYSQATFDYWKTGIPTVHLDIVCKEYVVKNMSRGALGKNFSWQTRLRGGKPGSVNAWETGIENLTIVSKQLQIAYFYNMDFRYNINKYDSIDTLFYVDPPLSSFYQNF